MSKTVKLGAAMLVLCSAGIGVAQSRAREAGLAEVKQFRLTFVLSDPGSVHAPQTIELDVPVGAGRPGMTGFQSAAGTVGEAEGSVRQSMEVTNVRETEAGLSASVSFSTDTITKAGNGEPLHHNVVFNRDIDVPLAKPTQITDENDLIPLGEAAKVGAASIRALKLTVTATQI